MKKSILFVDDEPNLLQGLQRMLRPLRGDWEMAFAPGGKEALEILEKIPCDVVVTDMRMPGMDGAQLLEEVRKCYPHVVRIVLSGQSNHEKIMKSVGLAHQYLAKPCDAETIKATVMRACGLRDLLADESLKRLVAQMKSIPSIPALYIEVMNELQSPKASIQNVGKIIAKDIGMTAKILQLVNSAFFGLARHVSNPVQAVSLLGLDTVKALVLSYQVFSKFQRTGTKGFSMELLWNHSMNVAGAAKRIAAAESTDPAVAEDAFMGGMLHDAGKLVLETNLAERYAGVFALASEKGVPHRQAEIELLGTTHAEVGAYLMGLWGLPDPIVEAIAFHHVPSRSSGRSFAPLTAVHVADAFLADCDGETAAPSRDGAPNTAEEALPPQLDAAYLMELNSLEKIPQWRALCHELEKERV